MQLLSRSLICTDTSLEARQAAIGYRCNRRTPSWCHRLLQTCKYDTIGESFPTVNKRNRIQINGALEALVFAGGVG